MANKEPINLCRDDRFIVPCVTPNTGLKKGVMTVSINFNIS